MQLQSARCHLFHTDLTRRAAVVLHACFQTAGAKVACSVGRIQIANPMIVYGGQDPIGGDFVDLQWAIHAGIIHPKAWDLITTVEAVKTPASRLRGAAQALPFARKRERTIGAALPLNGSAERLPQVVVPVARPLVLHLPTARFLSCRRLHPPLRRTTALFFSCRRPHRRPTALHPATDVTSNASWTR